MNLICCLRNFNFINFLFADFHLLNETILSNRDYFVFYCSKNIKYFLNHYQWLDS